ncbi:iron-only hydrogenase maturation protein HydF [Natranaerovirga hydrolytica]|uniref:Iron-only hydrogenase maturation protein HydF n=1 Tax=Natranaerovirga hydrolytica TaxID=680378 RepID=A0A4R1MN34_9FIRM|nr:[FeFe] hydrogenase H-cluster maturation GTPase HydF [Natranaerovirga hydrolytica]TCK92704.1 iron-only hydrogenase maturation protein HydF [Natranaerovirga hydrolytica]
MNTTPSSNRTHIAIYGKTNSGKSSLFNAIIGQDISIISDIKGTTTDPVSKPMELLPYGPVIFLDTAGLDDSSQLGELRVQKSLQMLQRTDFALYVLDIHDRDLAHYNATLNTFKKHNIPYVTVINKCDTASEAILNEAKKTFKEAIYISTTNAQDILNLKDHLIKKLQDTEEDPPIIGDIIPYNGKVILVVPIDSEAPKGRIILPQVQLIRDCLDHGIKSYVVRDTELQTALEDLDDVDLVVTDSQAFKKVNQLVPTSIPLTSFSIVFARYKGDLKTFVEGVNTINKLTEHSRILISESCTHNHSHEDIGRVKIPHLLNQYTGKSLTYDFKMGHDFPEDIKHYDLIIHCGSCMLNKKTMISRINQCKALGVPITNYGVTLAYLNGILNRCIDIF